MLLVERLHRRFGPVVALDAVSFRVEAGEIVGFLGPNGAGKTTTMRIVTGALAPHGGRAEIAGLDVSRRGAELRRHLGYLPEQPAAYPEMTPLEYLDHVARLQGLGASRAPAIASVIERCGLGELRVRRIGQLSKGYRQRVGLAAALVHRPPLLLLDEPTSGLDPNQVVQIRQLVRALGSEHAVLLSSHALADVRAMVDRIVVLARGRVVADQPLDAIDGAAANRTRLTVGGLAPTFVEVELLALAGVTLIEGPLPEGGPAGWTCLLDAPPELRPEIARRVVAAGGALHALSPLTPSLEALFHTVTSAIAPPEDTVDR